jgi:hypothetical protein
MDRLHDKDRMVTTELLRVMIFAMAGWIASSYCIARSDMSPAWRQGLIVPLWFAWMILGLGGPVYNGSVAFSDAMVTAASLTAGLSLYLFMARRQRRAR